MTSEVLKTFFALFTCKEPHRALRYAYTMGWLKLYLPEVHALYGVPQNPDHHPEVDCGVHMELCMFQASEFGASPEVRFAVLMHDLGKGITPANILPSHHDHEKTGVPLVEEVCNRFKVPAYWKKLALAVCENHLLMHQIFILRSSRVDKLFRDLGFEADKKFLADFVMACRCDATGRKGKSKSQYRQADFMMGLAHQFKSAPQCSEYPVFNGVDHKRHEARLQAVRYMRAVHNVKDMKEGDPYI